MRRLNKTTKYILTLVGIFIVEMLSTHLLRYRSLLLEDTLVAFITYTAIVFLIIQFRFFDPPEALKVFALLFLFLQLMAIIIDWGLPSIGLPFIITSFAGMLCGRMLHQKNKLPALLLIVFFVPLSLWYIGSGYRYWFNFINYHTFTGRAEESKEGATWYITGRNNDTLTDRYYSNKTVVFDFWNTGCMICYREFPQVDSLYRVLEQNHIELQSVNIPMPNDTAGQAFDYIEQRGYSFPKYAGSEHVKKLFGINVYPTLVIMENNKIVFRGDLYLAKQFLNRHYLKPGP